MMKKLICILFLLSSLIAVCPQPAAALSLNRLEQPSAVDFVSMHQAIQRMKELNIENDRSLNRKERKALEKDLQKLQKSAASNSRGAVTISVGSLLIIILILILIL
jgi:uncharacterized membrane protein (DUF106 family)